MTAVDLLCAVATVVLLTCSTVTRPQHARCLDATWYVNGVRPDGTYECRQKPTGDPRYDGWLGGPDLTVDHPGWYRGRIYCTGGTHPIVILTDREARSVGCQR